MSSKNIFSCGIGVCLAVAPLFFFICKDFKECRSKNVKLKSELDASNNPDIDDGSNQSLISPIQKVFLSNSLRLEPVENLLKFLNIFTWFFLMIICYILIRFIVYYFSYKHRYKYLAGDCQDIEDLCIRSFLIYILGNIADRFKNLESKINFIIYIIYFLFIYTITYNQCPNIELGGNGMGGNVATIIIIITVPLLILFVLIRNCHLAWNESLMMRGIFFGIFISLFIFHLIMTQFSSKYIQIHIHHHYWALTLSLACRGQNKSTKISQACSIAIFIHGIAVFGCENLFEWINVDHEKFKNLCHEWYCPAWKCVINSN